MGIIVEPLAKLMGDVMPFVFVFSVLWLLLHGEDG